MKILFVINTLGLGGAETALLELLRRLSRDGCEISLYVMLAQGELADRLPDGVKLLNKNYRNCSVLSAKGRLEMAKTVLACFFRNGNVCKKTASMLRALAALVKNRSTAAFSPDKLFWRILSDGAWRPEESYDLAVAYLEGGATYFTADHIKADKKVAFIHTDYRRAGYAKQMDQECYEAFERIFAISEAVRDAFLQIYPEYEGKTGIFYNLLNQERIRMLAEKQVNFTGDFHGYVILTVGRLTVAKAFDIALQAMALLKKEGPAVRWYVLGEGDQRAVLERQRAELGLREDFIFLGAVDNPFPYYRRCDLYVHATRYEGRSMAIQEAQTLGCAILASDCAGNRGQIREGTDGRLCRLTPESIAAGIRELLPDREQRERLGRAAAQRVKAQEEQPEQLIRMLL